MKLYIHPGACAMASHITATELGLDVEVVKVDLNDHKTESGEDFYTINPKGYVPTLVIDESKSLTEGVAILQFLADQKPEGKMTPAEGTFERYKLQEMLTFISSELHKGLDIFFSQKTFIDGEKEARLTKLQTRFAYLDTVLEDNEFLVGDTFSIADAYAFTIMNWRNFFDIDISTHKNLESYLAKLASRDSVQATMKAEGLIE